MKWSGPNSRTFTTAGYRYAFAAMLIWAMIAFGATLFIKETFAEKR